MYQSMNGMGSMGRAPREMMAAGTDGRAGDGSNAWGYGQAPTTEQEFLARFDTMVSTLLQNPDCTGFCYTQLYDVEQEKNGLYTYDRVPKFDPERIRATVAARAAVEE